MTREFTFLIWNIKVTLLDTYGVPTFTAKGDCWQLRKIHYYLLAEGFFNHSQRRWTVFLNDFDHFTDGG